jgi:transcriptional regulator with GAF, ATPase, and Fis domain
MDGHVRDLLPALAALTRWTGAGAVPDRALEELSESLQAALPHDRLVISHVEDDGRTFTIVAERARRGPVLHREHYAGAVAPGERYIVREWGMREAFAGTAMLVDDFLSDPRYTSPNRYEQPIGEAGFRAGVMVPIRAGGRTIGVLTILSLGPGAYSTAHRDLAQALADLAAPAIENVVLRQREQRRRERLAALVGIARTLGESLHVRDIFDRLAGTIRPVLDFDIMGAGLISPSGREIEIVAEFDFAPTTPTPSRIPLESFSFADRVERGETVLIHDAPTELDAALSGDRLVIDGGGRSVLSVPLWFGERAGGALYLGKRRPYWFDASDGEIAAAIAAQVVVAIQHQRLAEEQRRLTQAEGRARRLAERLESLRSELGERFALDAVIGRAPALREQLVHAAKVAVTETTVLLTGESGTGKELVARGIHAASLRADGPFVAINCAALPETLLESELFGHERGAFTGADRQKPGRFELAHGGTLFLDEVGELSPAVQAKLLRVLQEKEYERVGGTATLRADVRVIAASNRDLAAAVQRGQFREDLFYRLDVFSIHLPALRDRGDDVLLLADHFVRTLAARMGKGEAGLSREAREALLAHSWPGNIRELGNAIERALIVSDAGLITAAQLGLTKPRPVDRRALDYRAVDRTTVDSRTATEDDGTATNGSRTSVRGRSTEPESISTGPPTAHGDLPTLATTEKQLVQAALAKARGNKSRAAALLGLSRSQLYTRLKRFGLETD